MAGVAVRKGQTSLESERLTITGGLDSIPSNNIISREQLSSARARLSPTEKAFRSENYDSDKL